MAGDLTGLTQGELDELFKKLEDATEAHNRLVELTKWFPTPALMRMLQLLAKLKAALDKIPLDLWVNLIRFMNCDLEAIRNEKKEELLKLLLLIEAHVEIAKADKSIPLTDAEFDRALSEIRQARTAIENGNDTEAIETIRQLKERFKLQYAALWTMIVQIYHLGLLDDLTEAGGNLIRPKIGKLIKGLIRKLVEKILKRKLPKAAAKKAIPYVGTILTALELIGYGATLSKISDLSHEICRLLCQITREYARRGYRWPLQHPEIHVAPARLLTREYPIWEIMVQNFVRCSYQTESDDECVWGESCVVPFEGGAIRRIFIVKRPIRLFLGRTGTFDGNLIRYVNDIDEEALRRCPCLLPQPNGARPIKCFTMTQISASGQGYDPETGGLRFTLGPTKTILNGVKIF